MIREIRKSITVQLLLAAFAGLHALPQYTAREGRQCDSCHAYPFPTEKQQGWKDPELAKRKCNLSCVTCHVDPGGGGMRTVTGRYLAYSSLPIFNTEQRPWHDQNRNLANIVDWFNKTEPQPSAQTIPQKEEAPKSAELAKPLPEKYHTHELPPDFTWKDPTVYGTPSNALKSDRTYSPEYGIYGNLNADSKFQIGGDIRFAYVKTEKVNDFFPMQLDVGGRYHPVKHWTYVATLGLVGRPDTGNLRPRGFAEMYTIRNAFVMYNQLPYQIFFRAGFFQPSFGTRMEDHTAPVRQFFEMDLSKKYSAVIGAEAGFVANYPYLTVSAFTNNAGPIAGSLSQDFAINPQGFGSAVNGGWRDLLWGLGASFMVKARPTIYQGNLTAASVDGYWNFGRLWLKMPMTLMGEYTIARYTNTAGFDRNLQANYLELSYLAFNGVNFKVNHHAYDPNISVIGDERGRFGFGLELIPLTMMKFYFEYRVAWAVDPKLVSGPGIINPLDWLADKQFVFIGHVYF